MAIWDSLSWLVLVRSLQIAAALISAVLNGSLLVYIYVKRLGYSQTMLALEVMTCVVLIYTAIVLLAQHMGRRRRETGSSLLVTFVVGDVLFTGLMLGIITMLARSGLPSNCEGLTRSDVEGDDARFTPYDGYVTNRFSDGSADNKGELDKYCAVERAYYFVNIAVIFSYMMTITLSILRICNNRLHKRELASTSEPHCLESKPSDFNYHHRCVEDKDYRQQSSTVFGNQSQSQLQSPRRTTTSLPLEQQQGAIITSSTTPGSMPQQQSPRSVSARHSFREQRDFHNRPAVMPVSPLTLPTVTVDPACEDLLIEQQQLQQQHEDPSEAAVVTDGFRPHHQQLHQSSQTGGVCYLPPSYTPGSSSSGFLMAGHGNESNEMRLSEYVKGGTRAQDMKDSGAV